ncbi:MAG: GGDEF domain-containing protein [Spirochaetota bacterium]|jgi:diguanylate cyclase (GGDEF)-like protein|nr:GGDEF domain-containing protein [Spirochaetota bacterium]
MQNKIPQFFLLIAAIMFVLTVGHWLWKEGERNILTRQSERALWLANALQSLEQSQTDDIRENIEQAFQGNPDYALVLLNNQKQEPLFFKTRVENETLNWVRANLAAEEAAALLSARQFTLYTHELTLGKKNQAFLHIIFFNKALCEHRMRILIICALVAGIIILIWGIAILLHQSAVTEDVPGPKKNEAPVTPVYTENKKHTSQAGVRIDGLTSLFARGTFYDLIEKKCLDPQALPAALILADFDHFRDYNECFGLQTGDAILKKTAALFQSTVPERALCCRFGGEEFAVIVPKCSLAEAIALSELLRRKFARAQNLTMSFGVSVTPKNQIIRPQNLIQSAENALLFSKTHGRNMVSSSSDFAG